MCITTPRRRLLLRKNKGADVGRRENAQRRVGDAPEIRFQSARFQYRSVLRIDAHQFGAGTPAGVAYRKSIELAFISIRKQLREIEIAGDVSEQSSRGWVEHPGAAGNSAAARPAIELPAEDFVEKNIAGCRGKPGFHR